MRKKVRNIFRCTYRTLPITILASRQPHYTSFRTVFYLLCEANKHYFKMLKNQKCTQKVYIFVSILFLYATDANKRISKNKKVDFLGNRCN